MDNLHELTMDEGAAEELKPAAIERLGEVACPTLVIPPIWILRTCTTSIASSLRRSPARA